MFLTDELTEEHYLIGEQNGISRRNVYQRWYYYGYDIQRAITDPVKTYSDVWKQWKEIAKQNGVSNELYNGRLKKGMTPEQAATSPVKKRGGNTMKYEQTHLNAVGEITKMIYAATHEEDE